MSLSLVTAPRSPALTRSTAVCVLPCMSASPPSRSAPSRVTLWTPWSAVSAPDATRNSVMRPAKGSAIVFHTKAAAAASAEAS